jgi:SAM-dependent methyltransferase
VARVSTPDFWDGLYATGGDGWELGEPAPPLVDVVERTPPPRGRVAVLGCGRGHDARFLARRGYEVVGFDFSTAAVTAARTLAARDGVRVTFEQRDIFALGREAAHAFDGVWEYTCFCAIDPRRRDEYVRTVAAIVRPGGWLLACFFPLRAVTAGPPFAVSRAEVRRRFGAPFRVERAAPPLRSVRGRQGREWLVFARRT